MKDLLLEDILRHVDGGDSPKCIYDAIGNKVHCPEFKNGCCQSIDRKYECYARYIRDHRSELCGLVIIKEE